MAKVTQKDVREFWRGVVDENMEAMRDSLLSALDSEKDGFYGLCSCGKRVRVQFPDIRARNDAAKTLMQMAGEMPKQDGGASKGGAGFILKRMLVLPDGAEVELPDVEQTVEAAAAEVARG